MTTGNERKYEKDLVDSKGRITYGVHDRPMGRVNYQDFDLRDPLGRKISDRGKDEAFIQFQFLGFVSEPFFVGCALTKSSRNDTAFIYVYSRQVDELLRFGYRKRTNDVCTIDLSPDKGESRFSTAKAVIRMTAQPTGLTKKLSVSVDGVLDIILEFIEGRTAFETLRILTPTGPNGWTYAQKVAGIEAEGHIKSKFGTYDLAQIGAFAHHDYTAGFLRPETFWNWACISDRLSDGRLLGLNVSNGVNETGLTENCFWLDGTRHKIDSVLFEYDQDDLNKSWRLKSFDGRLDLKFIPENGYGAFDDRPGLENRFDQLFGRFKGVLIDDLGREIVVNDQSGFAERQYIRW